ncbi:MAG TPA: nucleotidyltransferase domain-containing protein [Candidatus Hydrogenedentes bacterium]|nr:nucleotidyltransferase domain-containing protein [Candidatus Hydrogenedentota bacterium]
MALEGFGAVRAVYVFGSQAEGRADAWSDLDLAVFMDGVREWDYDRVVRAAMHVQDTVGYDVETHLLPSDELVHPEPGGFAHYVLRNGVHVYGEALSLP